MDDVDASGNAMTELVSWTIGLDSLRSQFPVGQSACRLPKLIPHSIISRHSSLLFDVDHDHVY